MASLYSGVGKSLRRYWVAYGGWRALLRSPYAHAALAISVIATPFWSVDKWWDQTISVLPNLLGFTLGGFAVFLGFGDEKFRNLLAGKELNDQDGPSPYMTLSASFLHFVLVQIVALLWAIVSYALHSFSFSFSSWFQHVFPAAIWLTNAIGFWLFVYSILCAAAAAISVFRVAYLFDDYTTREKAKAAKEEATGDL